MTDSPAMAGSGTRSSTAFYADSLDAFFRASDDLVYAPVTSPHGYTLAPERLSAWRLQLDGTIYGCLHGKQLWLSRKVLERPNRSTLEKHRASAGL